MDKAMKITNSSGRILLKILAAMLIMMVGILGLGPLMVIGIDSDSLANELAEANTLAEDKIEELRCNRSFSMLPHYEYDYKVKNKYYIISVVEDDKSDPAVPCDVYRIHVNVNWIDHNDLHRSINYRAFTAAH